MVRKYKDATHRATRATKTSEGCRENEKDKNQRRDRMAVRTNVWHVRHTSTSDGKLREESRRGRISKSPMDSATHVEVETSSGGHGLAKRTGVVYRT